MARTPTLPPRDQIAPDAPLRLWVAAALAYPDGSMTASGLRKEAERGRLVIERTAGKDYTTLAAIADMRKLCRQNPKDHVSGSVPPVAIGADARSARPVWLILDGRHQQSTGCGKDDRVGAEIALERYLAGRRLKATKASIRDPDRIPVADVLALYGADIAPGHARPRETAQRIERLLTFFGGKMLAAINGNLCRAFVKTRSTPTAAREDLATLRAAINYHRGEGHCEKIVSVTLPEKPVGRDRWLTRAEAAKILWAAWRFRGAQKGRPTDRRSRRHVARFVLVALYSGTRAGAVCAAALEPTEGRGWIDLDKGIFYRRSAGSRETKKRRPPVPLPRRLLAHLRRWKRLGQRFAVEWNGMPIKDCDKAFRNVARSAGLPDVTPHALRHTAATWQMQLGTDPWQAAEYLGMTLKTLLDTYGHHHPNYLSAPREAFDRAPKLRQRNPATERERTQSNVTKIVDRSR